MSAENAISALESLIALSGNFDMPVHQAISVLRSLLPAENDSAPAVAPAPNVRVPAQHSPAIDEVVTRSNLMEMLPEAMSSIQATQDDIALAQDLAEAVAPHVEIPEPAPVVKKRRGRPRKNKA